jgi:general secretion pathway protein E
VSVTVSGKMDRAHPASRLDLRWVLEALREDGMISPRDVERVAGIRRDREEASLHPFQILLKHGVVDLRSGERLALPGLTAWLAGRVGQPLLEIDPLRINVAAITDLMSYAFAERHQILAVDVRDDEVLIASSQPFVRDWEAGLIQTLRGKRIVRVVTNPADIQRYTQEFYTLARSVRGASAPGASGPSSLQNFEQLLQVGEAGSPEANDQHIVRIVDWLLQYAFDQRASDIHLEPRRDAGFVRFRIDGVMHDVYQLPSAVLASVTSRIKIIGRMDVAEKRRPQDGRLKTRGARGNEVELRLSTLPTAFGEKLVMRIFDPEVLVRSPGEMGLGEEDHARWNAMATQANGIVLVTGPTGSGKTTTLYSTLKQLATRQINVCTIEDPIEMVEPAFNQMQVQEPIGLGFAEGLRALMRQDPDIIMVGEIRDPETAHMAVQAALTGHLVISSLHTNDAPSAITRLTDLGVQPYLLSATLLGVMAQRLVRTLCPHCKQEADIDDASWDSLIAPWKGRKPALVRAAAGCQACRQTGFRGRIGIHEVLTLSQEIKDMVARSVPLADIRRQALKEGMRPLRVAGAAKVAAGLTTAAEVLRVAPATHG